MKPGSGTLVIDISGEKAEAYEGTYQCTAHNDHGTAVSNSIVIRQSRKISDYMLLHYFHGFQVLFETSCWSSCWSLALQKKKKKSPLLIWVNVIHTSLKLWRACCTFDVCDSQGPPCGRRREMRPLWCRWGSPWCCSADPLQGYPLLSSSGWITVSHFHVYIWISHSVEQYQTNMPCWTPRNTLFLHVLQTSRGYHWINECLRLLMETCTFQMFSQKTAGLTTSAMPASLTHKPSSRNSLSRSPCWTVSQDAEYNFSWQYSRTQTLPG